MTKKKYTYILILFSYIILLSNNINAQGPIAPEAGSFEPIDATDMVNLNTGDFTYVLPLLKVPSPEGGYPISLSYHAGIAIDQEASWVGLGWNLNPGSIVRNINGYPDDWKSAPILDHFYDVGGEEITHKITTSYISPAGLSVGSSYSWGSNKGFSGSVGYGGANISASYSENDGFGGGIGYGGVSVNYSENGGFGGGIGYGGVSVNYSKDSGFGGGLNYGGASINWSQKGGVSIGISTKSVTISFNTSGELSLSAYGCSFQTNGKYFGMSVMGSGVNFSINNTVNNSDYNVKTSSVGYFVAIPTSVGVFTLGYSKYTVKWNLNSNKYSYVSGIHYLGDAKKFECETVAVSNYPGAGQMSHSSSFFLDNPTDCNCNYFNNLNSDPYYTYTSTHLVDNIPATGGKYFMDVYEIGTNNGSKELNNNNAILPALDVYAVNAQGLNGSMVPRLSRTYTLLGLPRDFENFKTNYTIPQSHDTFYDVNFYLNNSFSSSLIIEPGSFSSNQPNTIFDYQNDEGTMYSARKKDGNVVSYYTFEDVLNGSAGRNGLLLPENFIEDQSLYINPSYNMNAIAAYKIVTLDGKTYHYSLPVINRVTRKRTIGLIDKPENESFYDQTQPSYVTSWLLTAITGPDYIKRNGYSSSIYPDEGDYGYWVRFDYGKWSNIDVWKYPYGKDFDIDSKNPNIKTKSYGIKELYYLDKIKTRTHTALFVKNLRDDYISPSRIYPSKVVNADFDENIEIPELKKLYLSKIILVKNQDDIIDKTYGNSLAPSGAIYPFVSYDGVIQGDDHNLHNNIIDVTDNINQLLPKAITVIDFNYDYSLVQNTPNSSNNSGRLTLKSLSSKGKSNSSVLPPYSFKYANNHNFDINNKNLWGYYKGKPSAWSLNQITTPIGAKINIKYEPDDFKVIAAERGRIFQRFFKFTLLDNNVPEVGNSGDVFIKVEVDPESEVAINFNDYFDISKPFKFDLFFSYIGIVEWGDETGDPDYAFSTGLDILTNNAIITEINNSNMTIKANARVIGDMGFNFSGENKNDLIFPVSVRTGSYNFNNNLQFPRPKMIEEDYSYFNKPYSLSFKIQSNKRLISDEESGIRVKEINIDNSNIAKYYYNQIGSNESPNESSYISSGIVSYLPYPENSELPLSYGSELPSPIVHYGTVTIKDNYKSSNDYTSKTVYKFKSLDEKDENEIIFGDSFEINDQDVLNEYNSTQQKDVNIKSINIIDNFASLGRLEEINSYNIKNQLLNGRTYKYLTKNEIQDTGVIQESFSSFKEIVSPYQNDKWFINTSTKRIYPSVLKKIISFNQFGFLSSKEFLSFDPVTGNVLETLFFDSKGNKFKTKTVPAYTIPEYAKMGSKVDYITNKNMLSQQAASYTYFWNATSSQWSIVNASIQTWNNDWEYRWFNGIVTSPTKDSEKVWRKHKTFIWKGEVDDNGMYVGYLEKGFEWGLGATQTDGNWKNTSTITLYNHYSMPLDSQDINGNHSSNKMGDAHSKIFANSNAKYTNMYYSGAEEYREPIGDYPMYFSGEIRTQSSVGSNISVDNTKAHTGIYSVKANANYAPFVVDTSKSEPIENKLEAGMYKLSVWVYKDAAENYNNVKVYRENSTSVTFNSNEIVIAGDWVQLNFTFYLKTGEKVWIKSTTGTNYYDDFRLLPIASTMTSYVYNEWDELSYVLGANNMATKYEYHDDGSLWKVYTEVADNTATTGGFKLAKEYNMNYKEPLDDGDGDDGGDDGNVHAQIRFSYQSFTYEVHGNPVEKLNIQLKLATINIDPSEYSLTWYYKIQGENWTQINATPIAGDISQSYNNYTNPFCGNSTKIKCKISHSNGEEIIETGYLHINCLIEESNGSITASN